MEIMLRLHAGEAGWPAEIEQAGHWYEPHLARLHEDASVRQSDLLQLEQIAFGYPSRERLLTELTLDPPDATSDQAGAPHLGDDYLILSSPRGPLNRRIIFLQLCPNSAEAGDPPNGNSDRHA